MNLFSTWLIINTNFFARDVSQHDFNNYSKNPSVRTYILEVWQTRFLITFLISMKEI